MKSTGALLLAVAATIACGNAHTTTESPAGEIDMTESTTAVDHRAGIIDHTVTSIEGDTVDLTGYRGRPMLIVNTASKCGFTKFLVDADGRVVQRFEPSVDPMSDEVIAAVEQLLGT